MKRGQMEMAGLVIIVILITLGMLFALLFFVKKEPTEKKIFVRKGLAYSTMGTLLKTDVPCTGAGFTSVKMVDLLEDCARFDQFQGGALYQCDGIAAPGVCEYTSNQMKKLLDDTLGVWQRSYVLTVELLSVGGAQPQSLPRWPLQSVDLPAARCPGEQDSSGVFPEQTEVGILQSQLVICG